LPGHPQANEIYLAHPINDQQYIPASNYLQFIYEEKARYFVKMLMNLAVTKIEIKYCRGVKTFGGIAANIADINDASERSNAGVKTELSKDNEFQFFGEYLPKHESELPQDNIWYEYENTWKSLVEQRLIGKAKNLMFTYDYSMKTSLGTDLSFIVEKCLAQIGINTEYGQHTKWEMKLSF